MRVVSQFSDQPANPLRFSPKRITLMGNTREDTLIDLDLNEEPLEAPLGSMFGLGSMLTEIEDAHDRIEERIRQLEAVTSRARQLQARTRPRPQAMAILVTDGGESAAAQPIGDFSLTAQQERMAEGDMSNPCKRNGTHLVAKALGEDTDSEKVESEESGGFFDCNICLEMAKEPILTCCGHLFCWPCFFKLPYVNSYAKECPACKGEVTDTNVTPIYGNGDGTSNRDEVIVADLEVPPRPRANRIESARQLRVSQGAFPYSIEDRIRLISDRLIARRRHQLRQLQQGAASSSERTNNMAEQVHASQVPHSSEAQGNQRLRPHQVSRLLSQGAESLSSLSSALNSAERLVEGLEAFVSRAQIGVSSVVDSAERLAEDMGTLVHGLHARALLQASVADDGDSVASVAAVIQSESPTIDTAAEINSLVPVFSASSERRRDGSSSFGPLDDQTYDTAANINLALPRSSSSSSTTSRRRAVVATAAERDRGVPREPRRRRLN
ncbi:Zinc finger, C3HC4 RING-type [Dillenia turbinata]|uniref:E3 ubiquitin-protein ligase RMA n=1 Tax=Dillenia turbinata TaxID=194707 RepID=A0AAN8ZB40_9MAGN